MIINTSKNPKLSTITMQPIPDPPEWKFKTRSWDRKLTAPSGRIKQDIHGVGRDPDKSIGKEFIAMIGNKGRCTGPRLRVKVIGLVSTKTIAYCEIMEGVRKGEMKRVTVENLMPIKE